MKIAILNDTHCGVRNSSDIFLNYQERFYSEVFFPYLLENDIKQIIHHLKAKGIGVLITDHKVRETLGIIDRAIIVHDGHVLTDGKPEEIIRNDDVRRLYLGEGFKL